MSLDERMTAIIVSQLGVAADDVTAKANFIDDLGADSLDIVELVMAMEEEFDVEIPDEDTQGLTTVSGAVSYLKGKLEG